MDIATIKKGALVMQMAFCDSQIHLLPAIVRSVLFLALMGTLAHAQTSSRVTITPFSEAGVTLSPYNPTVSPAFAEFVQKDFAVARLAPFSAILTNASGKNIVAITSIWTWLDPRGKPITHTLRQDGLFLVQLPVAPSGSRVLLTPSNNWPEAVAGRPGYLSGGNDRMGTEAEKFESSSAVVFELDTVIFEDGLVIGPDKSETVARIRARKEAAQTISRATLEMVDNGRDPINLLSEFVRTGENQKDFVGLWHERIANMLLRTMSPVHQTNVARQLAEIPELNHLHRGQ